MPHIPAYAYGLFLVLLYLGITRCFPRTVRIERLLVMPVLIAVLGVRGYFSLFPAPTFSDLAVALAGGAVGLAIGWHHVRRWAIRIDKNARQISVPGDIMMLVIILGTFAFEFVLHYGIESRASWAASLPLALISAAIWSGFVGMSAGRNLSLAMRYREAAAT